MLSLSHNAPISRWNQILPMKTIRIRVWLAVFLLVLANAFGSGSHKILLASGHPSRSAVFTASFFSPDNSAQSGSASAKGKMVPDDRVEAIQAAIASVNTPSLRGLAGALGLTSSQIGRKAFEDHEIGMESINAIKGSSVPEVDVKWRHSSPGQSAPIEREANLYLLSWGGKAWVASYLTPAIDALTVKVLSGTESSKSLIAVILFRGATAVPYPVIFQLSGHHASVAWDSRAPTSLYSGYDYGSIQFVKARNAAAPVMIAAGLADPGLLVFPPSTENSGRGFQVATAYAWQNNAYVPIRTEFTHNRDYTLYRFISALHLHEYKTAYSLIDPKRFLGTSKPSLKLFRERILKAWPEFTDDQIFEVPSGAESKRGSHIFVLKLKGGKEYVYHPTFTSGPEYLLTGLKRTEKSE